MMESFSHLIRESVPLAPYTTLDVGGPARYLAEARREEDVLEALAFARDRLLPIFVLGGGSNILVSDTGFRGLVLRMALEGMRDCGDACLEVAAGEAWDGFARLCVERGLAGVECLSGIPGTAGGTPVQNVGAYGQEVAETIVIVRVLDRKTLKVKELGKRECGFGYRASIFNTSQRDRYIVLSVTFRLRPEGRPNISYRDLERRFSGAKKPSLGEVREAVLDIRASKSMVLRPGDPDSKSAGSFFKNPLVDEATYLRLVSSAQRRGLLGKDESVPRFELPGGLAKIPAAWLIEQAGFRKGYVHGRAGLSRRHVLALINRGGASAQDILDLMHLVREKVLRDFGLELVPEPVFVGFD